MYNLHWTARLAVILAMLFGGAISLFGCYMAINDSRGWFWVLLLGVIIIWGVLSVVCEKKKEN